MSLNSWPKKMYLISNMMLIVKLIPYNQNFTWKWWSRHRYCRAVIVTQSASISAVEAGPRLSRNGKFIIPGIQAVKMQEKTWFTKHIEEISDYDRRKVWRIFTPESVYAFYNKGKNAWGGAKAAETETRTQGYHYLWEEK